MASSQRELWEQARESILLVDDDLDDVLFFEMALSHCTSNINVVHARDGGEALRKLTSGLEFAPSLIITDLKMPGIDGFEFLARLKTLPEHSERRVIVFSSSDLEVDRERASALKVNGYHVKPVGFAHLTEEVNRIYNLYLDPSARQAGLKVPFLSAPVLLLPDKH